MAELEQYTDEQLLAEIERRKAPAQPTGPVRVTVHFGGYNARRYSRPWIAKVTAWPVGGRPMLKWGSYLGDDTGGECEIMAQPGDIIRYGQKDTRGNDSANDWAIAQVDGSVQSVTEPDARTAYKAGRS